MCACVCVCVCVFVLHVCVCACEHVLNKNASLEIMLTPAVLWLAKKIPEGAAAESTLSTAAGGTPVPVLSANVHRILLACVCVHVNACVLNKNAFASNYV